jgi:hypothetical protein
MLTKMKLAIVLCGSLVAGVASAQGMGSGAVGPRASHAKKYDLNHDGSVDAQERATRRADMKAKRVALKQKMIEKFDTNKDGKLDQNERATAHKAMKAEAFKRLDTNGDGSISYAEFESAKPGRAFARGSKHGRR